MPNTRASVQLAQARSLLSSTRVVKDRSAMARHRETHSGSPPPARCPCRLGQACLENCRTSRPYPAPGGIRRSCEQAIHSARRRREECSEERRRHLPPGNETFIAYVKLGIAFSDFESLFLAVDMATMGASSKSGSPGGSRITSIRSTSGSTTRNSIRSSPVSSVLPASDVNSHFGS